MLNWNNTWQALKTRQEKKGVSMKKSKELIFRIKCINNILPTKDVCYQRNSKLYKSQKCIACYRDDESLYHIAECEIYQKIWDNLEKEAIQLTKLEASTKLSLAISETLLREAIYSKDTSTKINYRKILLRGFTNNKQQKEVFKTTRSKNKVNKVLTSFIEHF